MVNKSVCFNCGKEFEYYLGSSTGKFCSRDCFNKSIAIPEKECVICKKLYTPDKGNEERWSKSKYCSIDCLNKSKFKGEYIKCQYCNKSSWKSPVDIKNNKNHFCSMRCYNLWKKGKHCIKNYKKGYRAEYEAMKSLEKEGYIVIRNFLSWGVFDIIALGKDHLRFIQVKSSRKKYPLSTYSKDIKSALSYNVPFFASKELWVRLDYVGWEKYLVTDNSIKFLEEADIDKLYKLKNEIILVGESPFKVNPPGVNDFITTINKELKTMTFIQLGARNTTIEEKDELKLKLSNLNGIYTVITQVDDE